MLNAGVTTPSPDNTPNSVYGGYLQIVFDNAWGYSTNTTPRHNIKSGNLVPAAILAEVDRKIDDGRPGSGRFQFSIYAGAGTAPPIGGTPNGCTDADQPQRHGMSCFIRRQSGGRRAGCVGLDESPQ